MTNTVKKIDEIITKIVEKSKESLSDKEARKFLGNIDEDLAEIEKSIEGKQKEILGSKLEEFRKEIDKSLSESLGWGRIKTFLTDDVKDDLNELKGKITKLELKEKVVESEIPAPIIVTEHKAEDELINLFKSKFGTKDKEVPELKNKKSREINLAEDYRVAIKSWEVATKSLDDNIVGAGAEIELAGGEWWRKKGWNKDPTWARNGADEINRARLLGAIRGDEIYKKEEIVEWVGEEIKKPELKEEAYKITKIEFGVVGEVSEEKKLKTEVETLKKKLREKEVENEKLREETEMLKKQLEEKNAVIESLEKEIEKKSDKTQNNLLNVIEIMTKNKSKYII